MTTNQSSEDYINDYVMYENGSFVHGKVKFIKVQNKNQSNNNTEIISKTKNSISKNKTFEKDSFYYAFVLIALFYFLIHFIL